MESGSFTDAGIDLGISQAAVSRNISALERALGVRVLQRTTRSIELTAAGKQVLRHARRLILILEDLKRDAMTGGGSIRIGYAWSALGRHTAEFQRRWAEFLPNTELRLVRTNSPTAGLAEGTSDFAILRREPDRRDFDVVVIGLEKRYCAMASDDILAKKRTVTLAESATATLALDLRTGSTQLDLWPPDRQPGRTIATEDVDDWMTLIGSGQARGLTAESTAHQYRRRGLVYRPIRDAPPVPVFAAWSRAEPPPARQQVLKLLTGLYDR